MLPCKLVSAFVFRFIYIKLLFLKKFKHLTSFYSSADWCVLSAELCFLYLVKNLEYAGIILLNTISKTAQLFLLIFARHIVPVNPKKWKHITACVCVDLKKYFKEAMFSPLYYGQAAPFTCSTPCVHYVNVSVLIKFSQKTRIFTLIIISSP